MFSSQKHGCIDEKISGDLQKSAKEDQKMEKKMVTCKFLTFFCEDDFMASLTKNDPRRLYGKFDKK